MAVSKTISSCCPSCGAEPSDAHNFCVSCGCPLSDEGESLIGTTIADNFRLDSILGEGAMGRVFKATQLSLDKVVALKVLHQHLAGDRNIVRRFHREARAASLLNHPNSLHIIDFGQTRDRILYIAMEYIEGRDLHEIISDDFPLPLGRIADLISQVCDALDEAHAAGVVHRDLKAENIMVVRRRDGRELVKVCDFGIAKIQDPGDSDSSAPITVAGIVCGTPEYMSPEQCRGEELDGRADVYSLGVLLYQLTTRALPFVADSPLGVVTRQLVDEPIPPTKIRTDLEVTAKLENIVLRAMSKDRDKRYASALELKTDVERALAGEAIPKPPSVGTIPIKLGSSRRRNLPLIVGLSVVGAITAIFIALLSFGIGPFSGSSDDPTILADTVDPPSTPPALEDAGQQDASTTVQISESDAHLGATTVDGDGLGSEEPLETTPTEIPTDRRRPHKRRPPPQKQVEAPTEPQETTETETPRTQKTAFQLGRDAFTAGDCKTALIHFERARQTNPGSAEVHRMLGKCYMRVSRHAQGRAAFRRYLELRPNASDRAFIERILSD